MSGYRNDLSESQRAALAELRGKLTPALLDEHKLAGDDLILWRVNLAPLASDPGVSLSAGQELLLLKFLRARDFDVEKALAVLMATLQWRRDFDVRGLMTETFPDKFKGLGEVYGRERGGGPPVTYNYYGELADPDAFFGADVEKGVAQFVRWRVQLMERAMAELDFEARPEVETVMQVHDYAGASMRPAGAMRAATKQIIATFADNYPETLSRKLFVNVPGAMQTLFSIVSVFSPAKTRKKFQMIGAAATRAALWEFVDPADLPDRYGGDGARAAKSAGKTVNIGARSNAVAWLGPLPTGARVRYHVVTGGLDVGVVAGTSQELPAGNDGGKADGTAQPDAKAPKTGDSVKRGEIMSGEVTNTSGGEWFAWLLLDNSYSLLTGKDVRYWFEVAP